MEKKVKLLPPTMPNFIFMEQPVGKREEGFKQRGIAITELTYDEAKEYGELMKQAFIKHHEMKMQNPN